MKLKKIFFCFVLRNYVLRWIENRERSKRSVILSLLFLLSKKHIIAGPNWPRNNYGYISMNSSQANYQNCTTNYNDNLDHDPGNNWVNNRQWSNNNYYNQHDQYTTKRGNSEGNFYLKNFNFDYS